MSQKNFPTLQKDLPILEFLYVESDIFSDLDQKGFLNSLVGLRVGVIQAEQERLMGWAERQWDKKK